MDDPRIRHHTVDPDESPSGDISPAIGSACGTMLATAPSSGEAGVVGAAEDPVLGVRGTASALDPEADLAGDSASVC